jgi:hypothetical protein
MTSPNRRIVSSSLTDETASRHRENGSDEPECRCWVKRRNTQPEQMFSGVLPEADIEHGVGSSEGLNHGVGMNIYELDRAGRPQVGWCFVPSVDLVAGDVMLAQKIALETDELGALAVARNFTMR